MEYKDLVKKRNKHIIIFFCIMLLMLIPFIPGIIMADNDKPIGVLLIFLGLFIEAGSIVYLALTCGKINKQIYEIKAKEEKKRLSTIEGKQIFKTTNNEKIEFYPGYFLLEGKVHNYSDYVIYAATRVKKDIVPVLVFVKDNMLTMVDLDGDLLETIDSCEINVINRSDLNYYLDNIYLCTKVALRKHSFNPTLCHIMEYKKNEEDAKRINKKTTIGIITSIIAFAAIIAFNILTIWFSNSESGNNFSELIGMDLIVKIGFSIVILLLAFYKAKDIRLYAKLITLLYLFSYWMCILFLDGRANVIISLIFIIAFTVIAIKSSDLKAKPIKLSRFFGMTGFFLMILMFNILDFTFINENAPFIISAIIMGVIAVVAHAWMFIYIRSEKGKKLEKKDKTALYICVPIYSIMFGFLLSWILLVNLNYAFDFSNPEKIACEIVDKKQGDNDSSDTFYVLIDGKKIDISVSDSEYFEYEIGDEIVVSLYDGAFNLKYYIFE